MTDNHFDYDRERTAAAVNDWVRSEVGRLRGDDLTDQELGPVPKTEIDRAEFNADNGDTLKRRIRTIRNRQRINRRTPGTDLTQIVEEHE